MNLVDYEGYHELRGNAIYQDSISLPEYFLNLLPKNKNAPVLDIGCGDGSILYALKELGYTNLQGIDLDSDAVETCKNRGIPCVKADIFEWGGENKYEFIMMNHVLEHLPKDSIISTLCYIKDFLMLDNGQLFVRTPNAQANTGCYWLYEDFTHNLLFTGGSLLYVFKRSGFKNIRLIDQYGLESGRRVFRPIKRLFIYIYEKKLDFWNCMLGCSFHKPSPRVYTWEIKMIAKK